MSQSHYLDFSNRLGKLGARWKCAYFRSINKWLNEILHSASLRSRFFLRKKLAQLDDTSFKSLAHENGILFVINHNSHGVCIVFFLLHGLSKVVSLCLPSEFRLPMSDNTSLNGAKGILPVTLLKIQSLGQL